MNGSAPRSMAGFTEAFSINKRADLKVCGEEALARTTKNEYSRLLFSLLPAVIKTKLLSIVHFGRDP